MSGIERIAAERRRQIEQEGWSAEHDDQHMDGELSGAAASYVDVASRQALNGPTLYRAMTARPPGQLWRWESKWWKPSEDPIRNLEKAGALIAAEIDRLEREAANAAATQPTAPIEVPATVEGEGG